MQIDIRHIAKLARLRLDGGEAERFETEMAAILDMVDNLPELSGDASGLDPERPMALRADEVRSSMKRQKLLANAPQVEAGCVVVPRIVD